MLHVILGAIAIVFGIWGIAGRWWAFLDMLYVLVPVLLIIGGIIALTAGISRVTGKEGAGRVNNGREGLH